MTSPWKRLWRLALLPMLLAACGDGLDDAVARRAAEREARDATIWADERLAGEYERTLVALWDALLEAGRLQSDAHMLDALASLRFESLTLGALQPVERLEHGIERLRFEGPERRIDAAGWRLLLAELSERGIQLVQSEWHHAGFTPPAGAEPARSRISVTLHAVDRREERRFSLEGELRVDWSQQRDAAGNFMPAHVDARGLELLQRAGPPLFEHVRSWRWKRRGPASRLHPILLYDLDRDGLAEIVSVGASRVLWNQGGMNFRGTAIADDASQLTETGVIAELTGDAYPDLLSTRARGDLVLYAGDAAGHFAPPVVVATLDAPLRAPSVLSAGDIDADGDRDVWLAQYRPAYAGGQMPSPYFDANDGYPAYLLRNDGHGRFSDVTVASGLAQKRKRRTYTSSLVDLDDDGDLDLLVVSDYAGVDLYHNDGHGNFRDANHTLAADRHLFGMSAAFADFDLDGALDFFVAGMASTTARRLEALNLRREDRPELDAMRMRMAFGNRMYLASQAGWREPDFASEVARTGWTWGTTAFDFDNDGDPDLFAANGHASGESSADYCSNFWTHDIYDGSSEPDPALGALFSRIGQGVVSGASSWDGHQKNHLLMNRGGRGFVDVAFLMGVADEFDTRSALAEDLDADGRVDLLVVEDHGADGQKLHLYRNRLEPPGHWIGVRLQDEAPSRSPIGATVRVRTPKRSYVGRVQNGETLMGQHAPGFHFGLGQETRVDAIEVRWPDGSEVVLRDPALSRHHRVTSAP